MNNIEKVNEKYPKGWYCEAFYEVQSDMAEVTGDTLFTGKWYWYGWRPIESDNLGYQAALYNLSKYCNNTLITSDEYLELTGRKNRNVIRKQLFPLTPLLKDVLVEYEPTAKSIEQIINSPIKISKDELDKHK